MKAIKGKFFSRGIHIKDMKELSASKEIEILEPQELVSTHRKTSKSYS